MSIDTIQDCLFAAESELYSMRIAVVRNDYEVVEHHASRLITLAGEIRRECFLATHTSGEVK